MKPSIVFFDEIDAIGGTRGGGAGKVVTSEGVPNCLWCWLDIVVQM